MLSSLCKLVGGNYDRSINVKLVGANLHLTIVVERILHLKPGYCFVYILWHIHVKYRYNIAGEHGGGSEVDQGIFR